MTANVRFVWGNRGDTTSSLTATSSAGGLVPANLQLDAHASVWRSTTLAAQTLTFQWAAAQTVDSICFDRSNLSSAATIRCRGYTNTGSSGLVFDQTVSPDTGLTIGNVTVQNWIPASYAIKELQVLITDAANSAGYLEISRACVGLRIEPVWTASKAGFSVGWLEQSKPVRAESLDLRIEPRGRIRQLKMNLNWLEEASRDAIISMVENGLGKGVWVSVMPDVATASTRQLYSFWGALVADVLYGYPSPNNWSAPMVFEEK